MAEETDSPILCFLCLAAKGNALMAKEEYEAARSTYEKALQTIKGTEHRRYLDAVYYNLVRIALTLDDWPSAAAYYEEGFPLVQLNPEREAPRFDLLKGWLLTSKTPPDFEQAEEFFEQSIKADETSGAVVLEAQTRFYLAQMVARKGEVERSRALLKELLDQFRGWGIPVWQRKCKHELEALSSLV